MKTTLSQFVQIVAICLVFGYRDSLVPNVASLCYENPLTSGLTAQSMNTGLWGISMIPNVIMMSVTDTIMSEL